LGTNIGLRLRTAGGDLDAAFAQAAHVVRQRYRVQRLAPAPLETRGVVAHYQPQDDVLTVWDSTQHPHEVKDQLATLLHRPEHRVRVVAPDVGGGFDEKGGMYSEEIVIPYLARIIHQPQKSTRESAFEVRIARRATASPDHPDPKTSPSGCPGSVQIGRTVAIGHTASSQPA
jgi:CO/xanthine dehydrogenase Mo-binding subunit